MPATGWFWLRCVHRIVLKEKTKCETIPADWHQTETSRTGRRSSRSASVAENRCSCLVDSQAAGPHEPSAAPCTPSQSRLHPSPPAMHIMIVYREHSCKVATCVCTCITGRSCHSFVHLWEAEEVEDAPFDVWDLQRRCLNLPEPGNSVQVVELHSRLRLAQDEWTFYLFRSVSTNYFIQVLQQQRGQGLLPPTHLASGCEE